MRMRANQVKAEAATNRESRMAWRITNLTESAEVYLYDIIGDWGTSAGDFVAELRGIGNKPIDLHINSEGGDVFDGLAIFNAIKNHGAPVTAYVDGLAASAASFIAMAAGRIVIAQHASMMIHDASSFAWGNADELRKQAALLDSTSQNIASIYAKRAGGTAEDWRARMRAETWYQDQEAVDVGLADEVGGDEPQNRAVRPVKAQAEVQPVAGPVAETDDDDDDEGIRVNLPGEEPVVIAGTEVAVPDGLGEVWRENASYTPPPTMEEMLRKQAPEGLLAAAGLRGGK